MLNFNAKKSITKTIFKMLLEAKGEWVTVKNMAKRVNKKPEYIRIVISQLKGKIKKEFKDNNLKIEPSGESSYRLIIS